MSPRIARQITSSSNRNVDGVIPGWPALILFMLIDVNPARSSPIHNLIKFKSLFFREVTFPKSAVLEYVVRRLWLLFHLDFYRRHYEGSVHARLTAQGPPR